MIKARNGEGSGCQELGTGDAARERRVCYMKATQETLVTQEPLCILTVMIHT